jgi:hypothetical protein
MGEGALASTWEAGAARTLDEAVDRVLAREAQQES